MATIQARVPRLPTSAVGVLTGVGAAGLAALLALIVVYSMVLGMMLGLMILAAIILLAFERNLPTVFLRSLGALLIGYALLGRGLAHVGAPPLYLGEAVLGLGVLSLLLTVDIRRMGVVHMLLLGFILFGVMRTIPYLRVYGVDALRDSVTWSYALFALAVFFALKPSHFVHLVKGYGRLVPFLLLWIPAAGAFTVFYGNVLPHAPGSDVPILDYKGGDMGVHLAGLAAFVILGLHASSPRLGFSEITVWLLWFAGVGMVAGNRGGMVAATLGAALAILLRPSSRIVPFLGVALGLILVASILNLRFNLGENREISISDLQTRARSLVSDDTSSRLNSTKEWRLAWWDTIIDYTFSGPYFWGGKGFGVNLADDDGFQVEEDGSLRAPHNAHLTVLARMGVTGLVVWIALHVAWAGSMLVAYFRARATGRTFWAQVNGWLLIYWIAMMVNGAFDTYLEGPQGGIWFWCVFGAGLAALAAQRLPAENDPDYQSSAAEPTAALSSS